MRNAIYTFGRMYTRWGAIFPGTCALRLKIEGKYLYLRAKLAHFVGHLPGDHKNNKRNNLMLIHGHCHDQITAQMLRTHGKGSVTEEPCAGKLARTVLKQRCEG